VSGNCVSQKATPNELFPIKICILHAPNMKVIYGHILEVSRA